MFGECKKLFSLNFQTRFGLRKLTFLEILPTFFAGFAKLVSDWATHSNSSILIWPAALNALIRCKTFTAECQTILFFIHASRLIWEVKNGREVVYFLHLQNTPSGKFLLLPHFDRNSPILWFIYGLTKNLCILNLLS